MSIESEFYTSNAVQAETKATSLRESADNEQGGADDSALGGSAPCDIRFEAAATDAAIFTEWQISRSPEFEIVDNSYSELTFEYTFTESGATYVRFVANNAAGDCEFVGTTYEIFIGESKLEIPNAFSPEASPGVNDIWKVSYKSLTVLNVTFSTAGVHVCSPRPSLPRAGTASTEGNLFPQAFITM